MEISLVRSQYIISHFVFLFFIFFAIHDGIDGMIPCGGRLNFIPRFACTAYDQMSMCCPTYPTDLQPGPSFVARGRRG